MKILKAPQVILKRGRLKPGVREGLFTRGVEPKRVRPGAGLGWRWSQHEVKRGTEGSDKRM